MKYLKHTLLMLFVLAGNIAFAQQGDTTIEFLDYWWKKCDKDVSHYYRIKYKEGNWWHVKDFYIAQNTLQKDVTYSDDSLQVMQGMTYFFHPNGKLQRKVRYADGKKEGMVKEYNAAGRLIDSGLYKKDIPYKTRLKWDEKGNVIFKGVYDENGYGNGQEWRYFEDGKINAYGITKVGFKRDSIWTYYRNNGVMSCQDYYDNGERVGRMCYDEKGTLYEGTCDDLPARPVEKNETIFSRFGQRYADTKESNLRIDENTGVMTSNSADANYKFKKGTYIVLKIYVDEKGKMTNVEAVHKIHPKVDQLLTDLFTGITKFHPAMDANRPVKASFEWSFPLDRL